MSSNAITPSANSPQLISVPSKNNIFSLHARLEGHTGLVLCMSITDDGKLASGGMDGARIWDLRSIVSGRHTPSTWNVSQFLRPSGAGDRGATTALAWIRREDEPDDGLIYGTSGGLIVCWREVSGRYTSYEESYCAKLANPGEITAIAFESGSNRLAVSNRNSVISVFRVGPRIDLHPVFSIVIKNHIPKALAFGKSGEDKEIHTFGLYDGIIYTLSGKDGKVEETRHTGCNIGNVAANLRRGVFCVDDPSQGAALYRYDSWDRVRTYPVTVEKSMRPRQISFLEDCKFILSGSDHGAVYIFDRRSGNMVDELRDGGDRIQALAATDHLEMPLIFTAMCRSGVDEACSISVWQKNVDTTATGNKVLKVTAQAQMSTWALVLKVIVQACFLIMAIGFLWQNRAGIMDF